MYREGLKRVENSTREGGVSDGSFCTIEKKCGYCLVISLHTFFLQFLAEWTLFSLDPGPKGGLNLKFL